MLVVGDLLKGRKCLFQRWLSINACAARQKIKSLLFVDPFFIALRIHLTLMSVSLESLC